MTWRGSTRECEHCSASFVLRIRPEQRYCSQQCSRAARAGQPRGPYKRVPFADRFWKYVDKRGAAECWPWTGARDRYGYGRIQRGGRGGGVIKAHRASWEIHHGRLLAVDELACHRCDNPSCVNPAHIFIGSHADNSGDMAAKGRGTAGRPSPTTQIHSDESIRSLRSRYAMGADIADLASEFGVTVKYAYAIVTGERRRLAGGPITRRRGYYRSRS